MRRPKRLREGPRVWAFLAAGASAGLAAAAFLAVPWPLDVVVAPALAGWAALLAVMAGREQPAWSLVVLALALALALGAAMSGLLTLVT